MRRGESSAVASLALCPDSDADALHHDAVVGVGTSAPYGHDGRSVSLTEVILRHGGEAQQSRDAFAALDAPNRNAMLAFLGSLMLFPPDDTASNLDPGDRSAAWYPQVRHGSIKLTTLFNAPWIVE
jgi:hypothetical protein